MGVENEQLINIVKGKAKEVLGDQDFGIEDDLFERGLDSMKCIQLIVLLEDEFNVVFEEEELVLDNLSTVNDFIAHLKSKLTDRSFCI